MVCVYFATSSSKLLAVANGKTVVLATCCLTLTPTLQQWLEVLKSYKEILHLLADDIFRFFWS